MVAACIPAGSAILTPSTGAGTNITFYNSSAYFHDVNYLPREFVYAFMIIGFFTILVSRVIKDGAGFFAIIPPIAFLISAWYANYMTIENVEGLALSSSGFALHTEILVASAPLSILMIICFLISLINVFDIFIASVPIKKDEKKYSEE